jgi:hypothetical protein
MDEFTTHILRSLVAGFEARAGLKDRNRALTEYEIARRAGYTDFSYVEFSNSPERDQVRGALDELERDGWVSQWQRAGRYDSYVPTELGIRRAGTLDLVREGLGRAEATEPPPDPYTGPASAEPFAPLDPAVALTRVVQQLDEALALLRAIDAKLGRNG